MITFSFFALFSILGQFSNKHAYVVISRELFVTSCTDRGKLASLQEGCAQGDHRRLSVYNLPHCPAWLLRPRLLTAALKSTYGPGFRGSCSGEQPAWINPEHKNTQHAQSPPQPLHPPTFLLASLLLDVTCF